MDAAHSTFHNADAADYFSLQYSAARNSKARSSQDSTRNVFLLQQNRLINVRNRKYKQHPIAGLKFCAAFSYANGNSCAN